MLAQLPLSSDFGLGQSGDPERISVGSPHSGYVTYVNPLIAAKLHSPLAENPIFCATCGTFIDLHELAKHAPAHRRVPKI